MSKSFRTEKTRKAYKDFIDGGGNEEVCKICEAKSLHEFNGWRVIANDFPYDKVAEKHSMLVPKRHTKEVELSEGEKKELFQLKSHDVIGEYNFIIESTKKTVSIPGHYHLHLLKTKDF